MTDNFKLRATFHFDSEGTLEPSEVAFRRVSDILTDGDEKITDLIILSHGWNENQGSATRLYNSLLNQIQTALEDTSLSEKRRFGVVEVYWPSQFSFRGKSHWSSGAAASSETSDPIQEIVIQLNEFFNKDAYKKEKLQDVYRDVRKLERDSEAASRFIQSFKELLKTDEKVALDPSDDWLRNIDPNESEHLLRQLQVMPIVVSDIHSGNAASISRVEEYDEFEGSVAAMSGSLMGGLKNGAYRFLTLFTYSKMRERANIVGSEGLNDALHQIKQQHPSLKLHLIGHSFGALLVTSAILGPDRQNPLSIDSLSLLQAAFSQYSFAYQYDGILDGVFRPVLEQVNGPILISHTCNDRAVGPAYALASKLKNHVASNIMRKATDWVVGSDGFYGGLGFNGAKETPESSNDFSLSKGIKVFNFKPKIVYNLKADTLIKGHSKIVHIEVAHAILSAIAAT